jgi:glycogen(starch) synthase
MRLAYCTRAVFPQHGYGGLERAATELMQHLRLQGVDVALFTRQLPAGMPLPTGDKTWGKLTVHPTRYGRLPLRPNGIPARLTNYRSMVEDAGLRVERLARGGYVQGVYAQGMFAWGVRRASEWGVPLVANPQGLEEFKVADPLKRLAYMPFRGWVRAGCRAADRVIATDAAMTAEVARTLGIDPRRVVVIPNGIDVENIRGLVSLDELPALAERWPALTSDGFRGISVGRLESNKGFDVLLRGLANMATDMPGKWSWFIVGDGSQHAALERLSSSLGLSRNIYFTGPLSDEQLHTLFAACDLFAHAPLYEGSSLVTLEAMAHGLPVVASAVGGIPDKVEQGNNGFLIEPGDSSELGRRVAWLAQRPEVRAGMGRRSAELVVERFNLSRLAAMTKGLFEKLIAEKHACRKEAQPAHA